MKSFTEFLVEQSIETAHYNLRALYDGLNNHLFKGELPDVPISFGTPQKGATGITKYQVNTKKVGRTILSQVTIPGSIRVIIRDLKSYAEDHLYAVVAHEMIHVWCAHFNKHDRQSHGFQFQMKLREVQAKASFHIPEKDDYVAEDKGEPKELVFFAGKKTDGRHVVGLLAKSFYSKPEAPHVMQALCDRAVSHMSYAWSAWGVAKTTMGNELPISRDPKTMRLWLPGTFKELGVQKLVYHNGTPDFSN